MLEERQLDLDEKPLVVQLNWNKDDREGRFVLKNENDILPKVCTSVHYLLNTCGSCGALLQAPEQRINFYQAHLCFYHIFPFNPLLK